MRSSIEFILEKNCFLANGWQRGRKCKKRRDIVCHAEIVEENRIQALLVSFQWSFRCFSMNRHQLFPMGMKNYFPHVGKRSCPGYFFPCVTHGLLPFVSFTFQSAHWFSSDILSGHDIETINHVWKTFLGSKFERGHSKSADFRRYFRKEILLIFIYTSIAFAYTLFLGHRSIHFITVCRWLIEASVNPLHINERLCCLFQFWRWIYHWLQFRLYSFSSLHDWRSLICVDAVCGITFIFRTQWLSNIFLLLLL